MISRDHKDPTLRALIWLCALPCTVFPCGSRYFGDAKEGSDFDFVTDDKSLIDICEKCGFAPSTSDEKGYLDRNTTHIRQYGMVQLIFVRSLELRFKARAYIADNQLDRHDSDVWEAVYETLGLSAP